MGLFVVATEKIELAKLNLIAGKKAKAVAAYDTALKYFDSGISLLDSQSSWHDYSSSCRLSDEKTTKDTKNAKEEGKGEYELVLSLYESATEAAYLCGEFERMEEFATKVLANADNLLDCVKVYEIIIQARSVQNKLSEAVAIALVALNYFGISFPAQPNQTDVAGVILVKICIVAKY